VVERVALAAFSGDLSVTTLLLDNGAEVDARARSSLFNTPLQVALLSGSEARARVLLERGANSFGRSADSPRSMKQRSWSS
jgi:ankyrin repeat protein